MSEQNMPDTPTCATCQHIGVAYWDNGFTISHHCMKEAVRRAESMPRDADLFDHFRAFFDAHAAQKACRHYEERTLSSPAIRDLLDSMGESGRVEVKFWSDQSRVAHDLEGKFVKQDWSADTPRGYRLFKILPVGKAERARAATAKPGAAKKDGAV